MVTVKICGITSALDACAAIRAGADMLGLVFYPPSPRYVSLDQARAIVDAGRCISATVRYVGVFVNESPDQVHVAVETLGLDYVQFHGREEVEVVARFAPRAYKSLQPTDQDDARMGIEKYARSLSNAHPAFIIDGRPGKLPGGNGNRADWKIAKEIAGSYPIILAGGLNPENVLDAIQIVDPWGVDVSSGVELAPGIKDHERLRQFIAQARGKISRD